MFTRSRSDNDYNIFLILKNIFSFSCLWWVGMTSEENIYSENKQKSIMPSVGEGQASWLGY